MTHPISISISNTADMLRTHLKKGDLDIDPNANVPVYLIWAIFLIYPKKSLIFQSSKIFLNVRQNFKGLKVTDMSSPLVPGIY